MIEFKGTKGKWLSTLNWTETEIEIGTESQSEIAILDKDCYSNDDEAVANALLISKAPEMLEMLQAIDSALDELWQKDDKNILFDYLNGIDTKQLIQEATELK